jgi:L-lactate dehydrogenase complex protein LldE
MTVTWHSSCHALREMNVIQHAKALIGQLKNVTLVELATRDGMLRFRGNLSPSSSRLFRRPWSRTRLPTSKQTGASTLLAGDCGCLMNITGAMAHDGVAIDGKHLAEFLWERTNGR